MKEGFNINNFDLEKAIKKMNKVAKDKYLSNQSREKRKLNIKEKKYLPKQSVIEKDCDM
ncbi:MAG TPA: hypothetical protein VJ083_00590 [Sedimentibacter sp.]|nr:hypothetical protein [Sedimentibacter sp.]